MRFALRILLQYFAFACALVNVHGQTVQDKCPKNEFACLDVMNGSQCIEQIIIEKLRPLTKESLAKCVEHEGTATNYPASTKYCRCPGCHTPAINAVLEELYPAPCA